jgi:hypothetical protein
MGEKARTLGSPSHGSATGDGAEQLDTERADLVLPVLSQILGVEIAGWGSGLGTRGGQDDLIPSTPPVPDSRFLNDEVSNGN